MIDSRSIVSATALAQPADGHSNLWCVVRSQRRAILGAILDGDHMTTIRLIGRAIRQNETDTDDRMHRILQYQYSTC